MVSWVGILKSTHEASNLLSSSYSSILGPALGGALAQPCISYPSVFHRGTIFDTFPFLLPNLVCAVILACGVLIGILFLEETHEDKKGRRDVGLETGRWLLAKVWHDKSPSSELPKLFDANMEETQALLDEDDAPPGYRTTEGSPRLPSSRARSPSRDDLCTGAARHGLGVAKAFNRQVILTIIGYGILA